MSDEQQSQAVQLSKAVAAQLSLASQANKLGPLSFTAEHKTMPVWSREKGNKLIVTTRPRGWNGAFVARGTTTQRDTLIEVLMRQGIENEEGQLVDQLLLTAEKVAEFYAADNTDTGQTRTVTGRGDKLVTPGEVVISDQMLSSHRVLQASVSLTFRGWR